MNTLRILLSYIAILATLGVQGAPIDRKALVERHNPLVTSVDTLASLSVGNGHFAFTADVTGLQTFPEYYRHGVPLGTQSEWGWHSFGNPQNLRIEESYKMEDFGHGHRELYATEFKEQGRARDAANWYRSNPHRMHLGCVGLEADGLAPKDVRDARQKLDMWNGMITAAFKAKGASYSVKTVCHPERDMVAGVVTTNTGQAAINMRFAYPTGLHSDDACEWKQNDKHQTELVKMAKGHALLKRILDKTTYFISVTWEENAELKEKERNYWVLSADGKQLTYTCEFLREQQEQEGETFDSVRQKTADYWQRFWTEGAAVDFSLCKDGRAKELERRVVLSQYLLAIQCCGNTPPQETGLTYNSWFGKFHMEMIWWHQSWLPLWDHEKLLARTLRWYVSAESKAREIAMRQGFQGVRWMKMTDPSGEEAPSKVGSYLIWQQPHLIYLAELVYRNLSVAEREKMLLTYGRLIDETADFMADMATYDEANKRYILKGVIPAQETLKASVTYNPPFELAYWYYGLKTANQWRERRGLERKSKWDDVINKLSPLAAGTGENGETLYLAAESAPDTYSTLALISDHPAVLGAVGILPKSRLVDDRIMKQTSDWIWKGWNWNKAWGWDYPMVAMNAARLGEPSKAVDALLMDKRTNTYLKNGHNYQDSRLRCYLPGNGGLLTAVAMMCAGWDGCTERNPGFPQDGRWNVRWEGLKKMP